MKKEAVKNGALGGGSTDTQPIHWSMLGGFTSIRTASVRASGLVARNAALESTKSFDGSMLGGFTSIRAASVRASGLAARNAALERTKSTSCSTTSDNVPQVQISGKDGASVNKGSLKLDNDLKKRHEDYNRQATQRYNRQPSARADPWFQNVNLGNAAPTPMSHTCRSTSNYLYIPFFYLEQMMV